MSDVYFDARMLPKSEKEYVAFLDIMGMQKHLVNSQKLSANFIFKFHAAILSAIKKCDEEKKEIRAYPIMDGAYVTAASAKTMRHFLVLLFKKLANLYLSEPKEEHRFIPRGALSYGHLHHGCDIPPDASRIFSDAENYKSCLLLGHPMVKAYQHECDAAPFGIHIDNCASCESHQDDDSFRRDWKWFKDPFFDQYDDADPVCIGCLEQELAQAFAKLAKTADSDEAVRRYSAHGRAINRYFVE